MVFFVPQFYNTQKSNFVSVRHQKKYKFPRGKVPRVSRSGAERERERETDMEILIVLELIEAIE